MQWWLIRVKFLLDPTSKFGALACKFQIDNYQIKNYNFFPNFSLDLTLYPFDDQLCRLIFGSWSYDLSQLIVISGGDTPVLDQYIESAVWDLLESTIQETRHSHSCCPHPFADIVVSIRMRRRFLFNNRNLKNKQHSNFHLNFFFKQC